MEKKLRIALLIDCDNANANSINGVIEKLTKYGAVDVRHAHGDWSNPCLSSWTKELHLNAIRPIQQFAYTKGKNATDAAMIIDAMDILHRGNIDALALMTSDSDFTPLVLRIRESGLPVYGCGEKKTPSPFVDACSEFILLKKPSKTTLSKSDNKKTIKNKPKRGLSSNKPLVKLLTKAVEETASSDGWSDMSLVGLYLSKRKKFTLGKYGYNRLGVFLKEIGLFKFKNTPGSSAVYIKKKKKK